jgi:6-phosphogluconolactonase
MAYDNLLSSLKIPESNIFRIYGEADPADEARRYGEIIKNNVPQKSNFPAFDIIMLGLGEDGHTASIFPDQMDLITDDNICSVAVHPVTSQKRITLTGRTINNAKQIVFIVTGKNKSKVAAEILNNKAGSERYPANFINPVNGKLIWLMDKSAAASLQN